jgi:hypothetical protein
MALLSEFETETAKPDKPETNGKATSEASGKPGTEETAPPIQCQRPLSVSYVLGRAWTSCANRLASESIVAKAGRELADAGVPRSDEYVRRWLIAEANMNNELRAAFYQRYENPDQYAHAEKQIRKAVDRLRQAARREPDPAATADRELVAAAVRGASRAVPPPAPPPRYGDMTDAEFKAELKKHGVG